MLLFEIGAAFFISRIQQCSIMKQNPHAVNGLVAVLGHTATHATGVVGGNAADHSGIDRCWIGADFAAERRQIAIGVPPDDTGLQTDAPAVVQDLIAVPVAAAEH